MKYKFLIIFLLLAEFISAIDIYVSPIGNDKSEGTRKSPFATFARAVSETKKFAGKEALTIWFSEGTYYLGQTIQIDAECSGSPEFPVVFSALPGARVVVKGSKRLDQLSWREYKDGIFVTKVAAGLEFDQLFINNER